MTDLVKILSNLVSLDGKILVDGVYDSVRPLTEDEENFFANVEFIVEDYKKALGYETVWENEDPKKILMNMWRLVLKKQCLGLKKILIYVDILLAMLAKELGQKIHPAYKHVQLAMELDRFVP